MRLDISSGFVAKASALVAKTVGKPESYVAVFVKPDSPASFGGSQEPCAFIELQSIGGFGSKTNQIADSLTTFIHNELKIDTDRFYINFVDLKASNLAHNGQTFG
uniref:L-dopachrome isomerase n=1 Tax=Ditylenchus dipsaci TaxID=166011 RepID=A0A915CXU6_9BILA